MLANKLLVLHSSALHLGYIGCYGNDDAVTPNLDRLADEGVVFDQHFAQHPRIGESPLAAGQSEGEAIGHLDLRQFHRDSRLLKKTLAHLDKWVTDEKQILWIELPSLAPPWHLPDDLLAESFPEVVEGESSLTPWLDPPVGPIAADEETCLRLQLTYAAAVAAFDALIGQIVEHLGDQGLLDEVTICVTANAGLALGEHGYLSEHRAWLHEEVVHLPMILRLPVAQEAGLRIGALTQPRDLISSLAADTSTGGGKDLFSLIRGDEKQLRAFATMKLAIGDSEEWALRTLDWHLVVPISSPRDDPPRNPQLFVKPDDRWEVNDVRQQNLELAEELESVLRNSADR